MNPLEWPAESRRTLEALHPEARPYLEELVAEAKRRGHSVYLSSVVRTLEEQGALKDSGQTRAKCSWHPLGRAVDLDLDGNVKDPAAYREIGEWWEERGGTWGGRFQAYGPDGDFVHFQWTPSNVPPSELCTPEGAAAYWAATGGDDDAGDDAGDELDTRSRGGGLALALVGLVVVVGGAIIFGRRQ